MKEVKKPKRPLIFYYLVVLVIIMLLNGFLFPKLMEQKVEKVDYGTFLNMVSEKVVGMVQIEGDTIYFTDRQETPAYMRRPPLMTPIW